MDKHLKTNILIQTILFFFLVVCLLPQKGYHPDDMGYWRWWALFIHENGLGRIYEIQANYQPVYLYAIALFDWIQGTGENISNNMPYIRIFPLLFDILPVFILLFFRRFRELASGWHWFLLLNVAYLYNSVIWGQVDSVHTSLSLLALLLAFKRPVWSGLVFLLAFNAKIQAIIFLPLLLMIWLFSIKSWKQVLSLGFVVLFSEALILMPFILGGTFPEYIKMVKGAVGFYPSISMNAFNFWDLVLSDEVIANAKDHETFFVLSYKTTGLLLFFLFSGIVLLPVLVKSVAALVKRQVDERMMEITCLAAGLVAIVFFFFNTQMHERYSHPAMLLFFFYGVFSKNFLLYIITSVAYFLNLEKVLQFFHISYHTLIFEREFIASLFALVLVLGIKRLYAYKFLTLFPGLKPRSIQTDG